jgi:diaminohydroxyphosphoribosylaminopyrimidine deaminase/5-amino-6-(5-phosphoribosylamino)uracil reductase
VFAGTEAASGPRAGVVERQGGVVIPCRQRDGRVDPAALVERVAERGAHVLLVEGGPTLAAAFLRDDLVDRWVSYVAPVVLGSGVGWPQIEPSASFHGTRATRVGNDTKVVFDRLPFHYSLAAIAGRQGAR